jgi:hypothetical protein
MASAMLLVAVCKTKSKGQKMDKKRAVGFLDDFSRFFANKLK